MTHEVTCTIVELLSFLSMAASAFSENIGESLVYLWVEKIREFVVDYADKKGSGEARGSIQYHIQCVIVRSRKVSDQKCKIECWNACIALKFGWCLDSSADKMSAKFRSNWKIPTTDIMPLRNVMIRCLIWCWIDPPGARFSIRTSDICISVVMKTWPLYHFIFIMGIPILLRWHIYMKTVHRTSVVKLTSVCINMTVICFGMNSWTFFSMNTSNCREKIQCMLFL